MPGADMGSPDKTASHLRLIFNSDLTWIGKVRQMEFFGLKYCPVQAGMRFSKKSFREGMYGHMVDIPGTTWTNVGEGQTVCFCRGSNIAERLTQDHNQGVSVVWNCLEHKPTKVQEPCC